MIATGFLEATGAQGAIVTLGENSAAQALSLRVGQIPRGAEPPERGFMLSSSGRSGEPVVPLSDENGWWLFLESDDAGISFCALFSRRPSSDYLAELALVEAGLSALSTAHDVQRDAGLRLASYEAALDRSELGILVLGCEGDLLFANQAAEQLLEEGQYLRRKGQSVSARDLSDAIRLQVAIEHVCSGEGGDETPVVALKRRHPLRPLLLCVSSATIAGSAANDAGAVIRVIDPDRDMQPYLEPVCAHYRLSPVETRLACQLARGTTLEASAGALRIKPQTARSYLKQIFLKTDTNRQSELVRMLLASTVRALPSGHFRIV